MLCYNVSAFFRLINFSRPAANAATLSCFESLCTYTRQASTSALLDLISFSSRSSNLFVSIHSYLYYINFNNFASFRRTNRNPTPFVVAFLNALYKLPDK
jgi:hypothetical protein